ncbi:Rhomboid protein 2 [Tieghemiomyces parasiticus]|uniref:rhomboid protease n=1 Tax=Tieghemiomyces parasiticus TaxID=78921 RepID=A0A9W7ZWJ3_9FUNG|nr:Rhomboid protein 2 [Tieghemiomyces parasiticus]
MSRLDETVNEWRNMDSETFQTRVGNGLRSVPPRVKSFLSDLPCITYYVLLVCTGLYLADLLLWLLRVGPIVETTLGLMPSKFVHGQVWRVVTYPLVHVSLFHLAFNMLALLSLSALAERRAGTVKYIYLLAVVFTILPGLLMVFLAHFIIRSSDYHLLAGTSGWVFSLLAWECCHVDAPRSFFGLFQVSSKWLPVVFLVLIEIIFPISSFFGHAANLACGYLYYYGKLSFLVPPPSFFTNWQSSRLLQPLADSPRFVDINETRDGYLTLPSFITRAAPGGGGYEPMPSGPSYSAPSGGYSSAPPPPNTAPSAPSSAPRSNIMTIDDLNSRDNGEEEALFAHKP